MLRRRQINSQPGTLRLRSAAAIAAGPVRDAAWVAEERLLWPLQEWAASRNVPLRAAGGAALGRVLDFVRPPLERLAWVAEERLLWPLQEWAASRNVPPRAAGGAALGLVIVAALGVLLLASGGRREIGAQSVAVRIAPPPAPPAPDTPAAPTLHGASPVFESALPKTAPPSPQTSTSAPAATEAPQGAKAASPAEPASPAASAAPPAVAGPAALAVARRFSEAFVRFETGQVDPRVRAAFHATATRQLAVQLLHRPPRLPANVEVPQARVLNVVPGPRLGDDCTVSVSLLRVGITSELRLSMRRAKGGGWLVKEGLG
jgi:hypothetical protein